MERMPKVNLYRCAACDVEGSRQIWVDDPVAGMYCGECGEQVEFSGTREAKFVSVALYEKTCEYGGPEEGGWYYDCGRRYTHTVRCFEIGDWPQAKLYMDRLQGEASPNEVVRIYVDEMAPVSWPEQKPIYC